MIYKETKPNIFFSEYIDLYTFAYGVLTEKKSKLITRTFPTFFTQLYFEFHGGISELEINNTLHSINKRTYVNCGIGTWVDIYQTDSMYNRPIKNFKVDLLPHTLYELFNISPNELLNEDLKIEDIWNDKSDCKLMIEQMEEATSNEEMINIFEKFFKKLISNKKQKNSLPTPLLLKKYDSIEECSSDLGFSKRWIQKQYKQSIGVRFKDLQNNMRFLKTLNFIDSLTKYKKDINFSNLAIEFNYYDQAHFIKEFKKYTGMTPTNYLKIKFNNQIKFYW